MNTKNMTHEQISALADGEATDSQITVALAALSSQDGDAREQWAVYHQIGDALRSDDLAIEMSGDFMQRMSARLEQEPAIVAAARPASIPPLGRRLVVPGLMAAATAAFAFLGVPHMMVALDTAASSSNNVMLTSHGSALRQPMTEHGEVLRDPDIDQYLLAHQRYSPSLYSTAQYARSPAFAIDSDK